MHHIHLLFLLSKSSCITSTLLFQIYGLFFNCYCIHMHLCICHTLIHAFIDTYIHTHICNMLILNNDSHMNVFRYGCLVLDNKLVCFFMEIFFFISQHSLTAHIFCGRLRSYRHFPVYLCISIVIKFVQLMFTESFPWDFTDFVSVITGKYYYITNSPIFWLLYAFFFLFHNVPWTSVTIGVLSRCIH